MTAWDPMRWEGIQDKCHVLLCLAEGPLANPPTNALSLPGWYLILSPSQPYCLRLGEHREGIKGIGKGLLASEGGWVEEQATAYAHTLSSQASRGFHSNPHKSKSSFYSCGS